MQNPHNSGPLWASADAQAAATASGVTDVSRPVQVPPPQSSTAQAPAAEVGGVAPAEMVNGLIEFFEWILDLRLSDEQRLLVRRAADEAWAQGDEQAKRGAAQQVETLKQVKQADQPTRDFWRETNQQEFVQVLRSETTELARSLIDAYDAANAPIAAGDPPLTREMALATIEMLAFTRAVATGALPQPVPDDLKCAQIEQLQRNYADLPADHRAWMSSAPLVWANIRASWPQLSVQERQKLQRQWAQELGLAPVPQPAWSGGGGWLGAAVIAFVAGLASASQAQSQYGMSPSPPRNKIDATLDRMYAAQQKEEERLAKESPELAFQKKLHNQQMNMQLMTNMMRMSADTSKTIIQNLSGWRAS